MATIFAIAGGLIAEMGGSLSHGAIIVREYGLPAVVNVDGAMTRLRDGQRVMMDADTGVITIEPAHHS
jgi:pyruvate,water dikinase